MNEEIKNIEISNLFDKMDLEEENGYQKKD